MIKKAYQSIFAERTNFDNLKDVWGAFTRKIHQRHTVSPLDNLRISDTQPDNLLAELELKMGKSESSFQQILSNSL
ncbi:MAG: hypothetical protein V4590_06880 [Bacteroidota bacterium]